jgi:hypothetical protein
MKITDREQLLGRWRIVEWVQRYDDGRERHPFGRDPQGFIQYDAQRMFCFVCSAGRKPLPGSQWEVPEADRAAAYSSCFAYSGTYELAGDELLHKVELSLNPNWVGTTQRRRALLRDERLVISARMEEDTSEARTAELIWER